jgi:hypothetical protein
MVREDSAVVRHGRCQEYDKSRDYDKYIVGFNKHPQDFRRVDQIIHSNKIEIAVKLIPKDELAESHEEDKKVHEKYKNVYRITALLQIEPAERQADEEQCQGHAIVKAYDDIINKPHGKGLEDLQGLHGCNMHGRQKKDNPQ